MSEQETQTLRDFYPYWLEPEQVQSAFLILFILFLFVIVAFVFTVIKQVMKHGISKRTLMGMKPKKN
jgi:hypothetical protein